MILPAARGCGPIELARCTGWDYHGPLRRGIMHGPHDSAATTQAAGHRIKSFEPPKDSAAARAQTVWARHQTSLPTSMTRWRRNRLHISQADCPCRKRQRRRGTAKIKGSRPTGSPPRTTMPASPLHRVVRCLHNARCALGSSCERHASTSRNYGHGYALACRASAASKKLRRPRSEKTVEKHADRDDSGERRPIRLGGRWVLYRDGCQRCDCTRWQRLQKASKKGRGRGAEMLHWFLS
jgi:hypothetical protein